MAVTGAHKGNRPLGAAKFLVPGLPSQRGMLSRHNPSNLRARVMRSLHTTPSSVLFAP